MNTPSSTSADFFATDGARYRYQLTVLEPRGHDVRPCVFLLHGFTGSRANWEPLTEQLMPWLDVLTVDLLGHGESDAPADPARYAMEHASSDLRALLDAVLGERHVHLLGYSMGGRLALHLAQHLTACATLPQPRRVQSLVLESASPGLATEAERHARRVRDQALATRVEREGVMRFVDFWQSIPLFASQQRLDAHTRERLRTQRLANRATGLANSLRGMGTGVQPSLWEKLSTLPLPVLLITGDEDLKFEAIARAMQKRLPSGATHIAIPNAGHTVHLEQPLAYATVVRQFFEQHSEFKE